MKRGRGRPPKAPKVTPPAVVKPAESESSDDDDSSKILFLVLSRRCRGTRVRHTRITVFSFFLFLFGLNTEALLYRITTVSPL